MTPLSVWTKAERGKGPDSPTRWAVRPGSTTRHGCIVRPVDSVTDVSEAQPGPKGPESALPSVAARVIAFGSILAGGALGAVIGRAFVDLQCAGSCQVPEGIGMVVGSLVGSLGVAIVAVLTLRALGEWTTIKSRRAT